MLKKSNNFISYLAGIFDAEGTVVINIKRPAVYNALKNTYYYVCASISNNNRDILKDICLIYNGSIFTKHNSIKNNKWKDSYSFKLYNKKAIVFLKDIFEYSIIKRKRILLALKFDAGIHGKGWPKNKKEIRRRCNIYERMKELNR